MITIHVQKLTSLIAKTKGLLGVDKPHPVLIRTRFGIHTFGMKYPIDVVILDKNNVIKKMQSNLTPYKVFFWNPLYDKVLELPSGMVIELRLHVGLNLILRDF